DGDERAEGRLATLDLLACERLGDEVQAGAAVLLRNDDPEQAELCHAVDHRHLQVVVDVVLDRVWEHALVHEGPDGVLDQPLLVRELVVPRGQAYSLRRSCSFSRLRGSRSGRCPCSAGSVSSFTRLGRGPCGRVRATSQRQILRRGRRYASWCRPATRPRY